MNNLCAHGLEEMYFSNVTQEEQKTAISKVRLPSPSDTTERQKTNHPFYLLKKYRVRL